MGNFYDRWDQQMEKDMPPTERKLYQGRKILDEHPLLGQLRGRLLSSKSTLVSKDGACVADGKGAVSSNHRCNFAPDQWAYCLAHALLHLAFGHFDKEKMPEAETDPVLWNKACDICIAQFLADIKFGDPICPSPADAYKIRLNDERKIYAHLKYIGDDGSVNPYGTNHNKPDMLGLNHPLTYKPGKHNNLRQIFRRGLEAAEDHCLLSASALNLKRIDLLRK